MPNQRSKTKAFIAGFYQTTLKEELKRMAKARGIPLSKLVEELLEKGVKDYKRRREAA